MALTLTDATFDASRKTIQEPSLVLEIQGYDRVFSNATVYKINRTGDYGLTGDDTLGAVGIKKDVLKAISMDGSTTSVNSQIEQDKGGASSITSIQIALVDLNQEITRLVSPGIEIDDILGSRAWVYLSYVGTTFPDDYSILFNGIVDDVTITGGKILITVSNSAIKKRQEIFKNIEVSTVGAMTNVQTSFIVDSAENFLEPSLPEFETYVKIDDEIIKYTTVNTGTNTIGGCTRAQFGTIAATHDDESSVASFYRLQDNGIDLALKLMLSSVENEYYLENITVSSFVTDANAVNTTNAIHIVGVDVVKKYGFNIGDYVTTTGATNGANNVTLATIQSIDYNITTGSTIVLTAGALVAETSTAAVIKIKSKYNVLPDGLGMGGDEVDVAEFERISLVSSGSIQTYDFYLKDTINGKDFIDKEILYPSNLFSLPKNGKTSLGEIAPPLLVSTLKAINKSNLTNPQSVQIKRQIGKYFYNTYIMKYDLDAVENKSLSGYIRTDEDSKNQIKVGVKAITIKANGLRRNAETDAIIAINSTRFLDRYRFAAEQISCSCFYGDGFSIDVGDVVLFGDTDLPYTDTTRGDLGFYPRLCEVTSKRMDIKSGKVDLVLLDTGYLISGRYGIISPSSILDSGSTASTLVITDSYGIPAPLIEKSKWLPFIGKRIIIRDIAWANVYESVLYGFNSDYEMSIKPISVSPAAGLIVEIPPYPDGSDPDDDALYKNMFVYFDPIVPVDSGVDNFTVEVDAGDISKFLVGQTVLVRKFDWSVYSSEIRIASISGNFLTMNKTIGFTPDNTYYLDIIGFQDAGAAYRYR